MCAFVGVVLLVGVLLVVLVGRIWFVWVGVRCLTSAFVWRHALVPVLCGVKLIVRIWGGCFVW